MVTDLEHIFQRTAEWKYKLLNANRIFFNFSANQEQNYEVFEQKPKQAILRYMGKTECIKKYLYKNKPCNKFSVEDSQNLSKPL